MIIERTAVKENLLIKKGKTYKIEVSGPDKNLNFRVFIPDNRIIPHWDLTDDMFEWYFVPIMVESNGI